jgi:hypothetical protein
MTIRQYLDTIFFNKSITYQSRIIGIFLFVIGFIFLYTLSEINVKLTVISFFIGVIIFLFINEKSEPSKINQLQIAILIIMWSLLILVITRNVEFDIFFIVLVLGIIVLKEILYDSLSDHLQFKLTILVYSLLIIIVIIFIKRIINISTLYPR